MGYFRSIGLGFLLYGLFLFLSSCTSLAPLLDSRERKEMTGLEEMSFEYIKGEWGEPDSLVSSGEKRVVHYKNIRSQDKDPISAQLTLKTCVVKLELDKADLVTAWEYESCQIVK
jgi:hypothetical protein